MLIPLPEGINYRVMSFDEQAECKAAGEYWKATVVVSSPELQPQYYCLPIIDEAQVHKNKLAV